MVARPSANEDQGLCKCKGHRPWLGGDADESCDEWLRLLVRTASNSYFSQVVSALTVPEPGKDLEDVLGVHWATLQAATDVSLPAFRTIPDIGRALDGWDDDTVLRAVQAKIAGAATAREPLRTAEFKQFVAQPVEEPGERPGAEEFFARQLAVGEPLPHVARIVLASKLREVRAQIGFTRLEPSTPDLQGEYDLAVESAPLGLNTDWLPATEVLGEGVFLQISEASLEAWEARLAVKKREDELDAGYAAWRKTLQPESQERTPGFPGARYYMLHSLSHLLISAISLELALIHI